MAPFSYSTFDCAMGCSHPKCHPTPSRCHNVATPVTDFLSEWGERKLEGHRHDESLAAFVDRIRNENTVTTETFILALLYADRYRRHGDARSQPACGHCVFVGSLVLASKYLQDVPYNNSHSAKLAGIDLALLNSVEVWLLQGIRCELYVVAEHFAEWKDLYKAENWSYSRALEAPAAFPTSTCPRPASPRSYYGADQPMCYNSHERMAVPRTTKYEHLAASLTPPYSARGYHTPAMYTMADPCYLPDPDTYYPSESRECPKTVAHTSCSSYCMVTSSCDSLEPAYSPLVHHHERSHSRQSIRFQPYRRSGLSPAYADLHVERGTAASMCTPAWSSRYARAHMPTSNTNAYFPGCSVVV
eukprot:comp11715_c0_seq1/m.6286 comp11715_c0_seq1/g.6286  ORF comp11715_c0_seq1/g.6286 comp11715_c0_seq1/m.6286 type:complete len:359 (-) comp11715_c0_seq1:435-1511(-)